MNHRTLPHPKLVPSTWEQFDGYNTRAYHPILGDYQKIGMGWYQRRRSNSGITFRIGGNGDVSDESCARWVEIEKSLDELVAVAMANMTEPWEDSNSLDANELKLDDVKLRFNDQVDLIFDSPYCRIHHEAPLASFRNGVLQGVEWIT